ncbi:U32 family peptidase [Acholeplasma sp. OttesenSCG-928-E16]|nr:U32 family peptidase [Acholeplasma sp. OttesenSCG-928-E16]
MIELLAPAGDLEKLKIAYIYGADACFIGGKEFSLRSRASNFSLEDIKEGASFAHQMGRKLYVTTNIIPHEKDLTGLKEYLLCLEEAKVDAIITASDAIMKIARKYTNLEIHVSTQNSITNSYAANYYYDNGAKRVVLARELSIDEIKELRRKTRAQIEVFIHGGMCMSYSGRCSLSNNMTDRDANRGGCAHSCRWNYYLSDKDKVNFSLSSKDLMAVSMIKDLMDAKVDSLKIEGRMKSLHYIATVTKVYRMVIDEYSKNGEIKDISKYKNEILKAENRLTYHGYLSGIPNSSGGLYNERSEQPIKNFIGIVIDYDEEKEIVTIEQRNHFKPFEKIEFFMPNEDNIIFDLKEIYDENMSELDAARHPKQIIKFKVPFKPEKYSFIRRV